MYENQQHRVAHYKIGNHSIYGVVLNDHSSRERLGEQLEQAPYQQPPNAPILYIKPRNTVIESGSCIELPRGESEVEIAATLGLVASKTITRVLLDDALTYLEGIYLVADLSLPHSSYYRPAIREKCFDGACPIADNMMSSADMAEDQDLKISLKINDKEIAQRCFDQQVRSSAQLLVDVTEFMTLQPGDMLLIGVTFQAPKAKAGDHVSLSINGLSELSFTVSSHGGE